VPVIHLNNYHVGDRIKKTEMEGRGHVGCVRERRVVYRVFGGES